MLRKRILNSFVVVFALIGAVFSLWFVIGFVQDLGEGDETNGGYEYPYTGWTGTPIDYGSWYETEVGFFHRGRVVDQVLNCTTGQLTFRILGAVSIDFRPFSDRAKIVHQPQLACRERSFDTSSWDAIDDPDGIFTDLS
jgi:hypothetical protein